MKNAKTLKIRTREFSDNPTAKDFFVKTSKTYGAVLVIIGTLYLFQLLFKY